MNIPIGICIANALTPRVATPEWLACHSVSTSKPAGAQPDGGAVVPLFMTPYSLDTVINCSCDFVTT